MKYKFRGGFRGDVSPQLIGDAIRSIAERDGSCSPEALLDEASEESSPLHSMFEWDDSKAAHEYRVSQARYYIRAVAIIRDDVELEPIRAFVRLSKDEGYRDINVVMSNKESRDELLRKAWKELQSWKKRYEQLSEFADIFSAMDKVASNG